MRSRKKLLAGSRLYVIIDKKTAREKPVLNIVRGLIASGTGIIQLRDKEADKAVIFQEAREMRRLLAGHPVLFIVNDHPDIARITDSDGVHLGQGDHSIEIARKILGRDKIIGVSCHSLQQAREAEARGADYLGIGPIFATPTKPQAGAIGPELLARIRQKIKIPFFAIGGINRDSIREVMLRGAERVAVAGAVCAAKDVFFAARQLAGILH